MPYKDPKKATEQKKKWALENKWYSKKYYFEHKTIIDAQNKALRLRNKVRCKIVYDAWRKKNWVKIKERIRKKTIERYYSDPSFKLKMNFSRQLRYSLANVHCKKNGRKWEKIVGYNVESLRKHLEKNTKFILKNKVDMDHKTPLSWFDFKNENDQTFKDAWALQNLQLLPHKENVQKKDYYCADVLLALSLIGR